MGESGALYAEKLHEAYAEGCALAANKTRLPACYGNIRQDANSRLPPRRLQVGDSSFGSCISSRLKKAETTSLQCRNFIVN